MTLSTDDSILNIVKFLRDANVDPNVIAAIDILGEKIEQIQKLDYAADILSLESKFKHIDDMAYAHESQIDELKSKLNKIQREMP